MENMITIKIDNTEVSVPKGTTVLKAAKKANIKIPTLCYLEGISSAGSCRMCIVYAEKNGKPFRNFPISCKLKVEEGMVIKTNTKEVLEARRINLELIFSNHDQKCLSCIRGGECELQTLANDLDVNSDRYIGEKLKFDKDIKSLSIVRDPEKCILCGRCVAACSEIQQIGAIGVAGRGFETMVKPAFNKSLSETNCINCGQCIKACPTGALHEKEDIDLVWEALSDPSKHVIIQTAPSVRVGIAEEFGMPVGTIATGKMVAGLRRLGFDKIVDTNFGADLTIVEEAYEFVTRLKTKENFPMMTSCCPSWVHYVEKNYPEMIPNLSTCKSPQGMVGAIVKTYYAQKNNLDPKDIVSIGLMPCTAKKYEIKRAELNNDIDIVITTREIARMFKQSGIDFTAIEEDGFDPILSEASGAGAIFGVTGGVMEAALRTVSEIITKEPLEEVNFNEVRGLDGIKEATLEIAGKEITVAVANGLGNAKMLIERIKKGEKEYHFIEVMACPGGCINGGGQPIVNSEKRLNVNSNEKRSASIYEIDAKKIIRKAHENNSVFELYKNFIGAPNNEKAHELLHTNYAPKEKYSDE